MHSLFYHDMMKSLEYMDFIFSFSFDYRMYNTKHEPNQESEQQTSGSEVVEVGSTNEVKTKPKQTPRQPNHTTFEKRLTIWNIHHEKSKNNTFKKQRRKRKQPVKTHI